MTESECVFPKTLHHSGESLLFFLIYTELFVCAQVVGNRDRVPDVLRDFERQTGEEDLRLYDVPAGRRTRSVNKQIVYLGEMFYLYYS